MNTDYTIYTILRAANISAGGVIDGLCVYYGFDATSERSVSINHSWRLHSRGGPAPTGREQYTVEELLTGLTKDNYGPYLQGALRGSTFNIDREPKPPLACVAITADHQTNTERLMPAHGWKRLVRFRGNGWNVLTLWVRADNITPPQDMPYKLFNSFGAMASREAGVGVVGFPYCCGAVLIKTRGGISQSLYVQEELLGVSAAYVSDSKSIETLVSTGALPVAVVPLQNDNKDDVILFVRHGTSRAKLTSIVKDNGKLIPYEDASSNFASTGSVYTDL